MLLFNGLGGQVAVFGDIILNLRHQVVAQFIRNAGPPAEVVQAEVAHIQILGVLIHNVGHAGLGGDGHIANIDDACFGTHNAAGFGYDGSGVGVIQNPAVRRILIHVIDDLHHAGNAAHAISDAAGAAGLLADHAVTQGDLFVLLTHGKLAYADVRHAEVLARKGYHGVNRVLVTDLGSLLMHQNLDCLTKNGLALGIIIIQRQRFQRKTILVAK